MSLWIPGSRESAPRNDRIHRAHFSSPSSERERRAQWPFELKATGDSARTLRPVTMLAVAAANFLK